METIMYSAESTLQDIKCIDKIEDQIELIKFYAKQVSEQALQDAAKRATYIRIGKSVSINPDSILNIEIKTP